MLEKSVMAQRGACPNSPNLTQSPKPVSPAPGRLPQPELSDEVLRRPRRDAELACDHPGAGDRVGHHNLNQRPKCEFRLRRRERPTW
jgi:hypothetical protein